jgi:outer membrane protein OmpA-like peptidoglycan-associated protein
MLSSLLAIALQAAAPPPTIDCSASDRSGCATSIYFDSGEGTAIRSEWTTGLDEVAARLRGGGSVRIDSFTDRSGPDLANRHVAVQRARSVQAALVERGVPTARMKIVAHGEANPLVATPDGVREPQNRRVDLTIVP